MAYDYLQTKLLKNPRMKAICGFRDSSVEEVEEFKAWLREHHIKYRHKTHREDTGEKLPYNGVIMFNPKNWKQEYNV